MRFELVAVIYRLIPPAQQRVGNLMHLPQQYPLFFFSSVTAKILGFSIIWLPAASACVVQRGAVDSILLSKLFSLHRGA